MPPIVAKSVKARVAWFSSMAALAVERQKLDNIFGDCFSSFCCSVNEPFPQRRLRVGFLLRHGMYLLVEQQIC